MATIPITKNADGTGTINGNIYNLDASGTPTGAKVGTAPTTMGADVLNSTPSPYYTPPIATDTTSNSAVDAGVANYKSMSDNLAKQEQANIDSSTTDLKKYFDQLTGVNTDLGNVNNSVDRTAENAARLKADEYTNQIEAEQRANQKQIEDIRKNFGGTTAGASAEIARVNRESLSKQADLALLQNAATRNYSTMNAIAEQQVKNNLSVLTAKADNLKLFIDLNKDNLTKAEEKLFTLKHEQVQSQLEKETALQNSIQQIKIEAAKNGASAATLASLGNAKTIDDAIKAAGTYLATSQNDFVKLGNGNTLLVDKRTGKTIKNLGGAAPTSGNLNIPSSVIRTVSTTSGAKPVSGYTLQPGDDPYNIATQNGTDMATLKTLNPNIKDWTKLLPGTVINLPDPTNSFLNGKTDKQVQAFNSIPSADRESVKQLISGDALLSDLVRSRGIQGSAQIQKLINEASSVDPNFSVNSNKIKFAANQKWNDPNGKSFQTRSAMNTAMSHMATTYETAQTLGNTKIPKWNDVANWTSKNAGNPQLTNFVYDLTVLSAEIASAYKNGQAPTDQETEKVYNSMSGNMSPAQLQGIFTQSSKLMAGKLGSISQEYKQSTGAYPTDPIIQPNVLAELKSQGVDTSTIENILTRQGYNIPQNTVSPENQNTLDTLFNSSTNTTPPPAFLLDNWLKSH